MKFTITAAILALASSATPFDFTPDRSSEVAIVFDGEMTQDVFYYATNRTMEQLPALTQIYDKAGFQLGVSFGVAYGSRTSDCVKSTELYYRTEHQQEMLKGLLASSPVLTNDGDRRSHYAILDAIKSFTGRGNRRVVMYVTDHPDQFGNYSGSFEGCETEAFDPLFFSAEVEASQTGLLLVIITPEAQEAVDKAAELIKIYEAVTITDLQFDTSEVSDEWPFDSIEQFLAETLSPTWLASTTTAAPSAIIKHCMTQALGCGY